MKNFIAGVLVTSSLLLLGFQGKQAKPKYRYYVQDVWTAGRYVNFRLGGDIATGELNEVAAKGGVLVHVVCTKEPALRYSLVWAIPK